ncbi:MAG: EAL domain-containing protein, partial [Myxococcales bacterium]|nr:EAL domain-containing protein [Myxococcales bacterium]
IASPQRLPYLNFSFYEGSILERYFFHFAALPNQQIDRMIPAMARRHGAKMFFAGADYEWSMGSIDAAKRALLRTGGEVVGEEYFPMDTQDFAPLLGRIARSGADVFVPYAAGMDQIRLLRLFTRLGLKARIAVVMGHFDEAMVAALAPEVREGFYSSNTYFMSLESEENRRILAALEALPAVDGIWPEGEGVLTNFGEGTYVCVRAFAAAANACGSLEPERLVEALKVVRIQAPQGLVSMDPATHHAEVNSYLARCDAAGRFEIVERFGAIAPHLPERYLHDVSRLSCPPPAFDLEPPSAEVDAARLALDLATIEVDEPRRAIGEFPPGVLDALDAAVIAADSSGRIVAANAYALEHFGYAREALLQRTIDDLIPPRFRTRHREQMREFSCGSHRIRRMRRAREVAAYRSDGTEFPADAAVAKVDAPGGQLLLVTLRDATRRKREEATLAWRASHDSLTDLPNRALVLERLENALARARRTGQFVALLFIDLDNFKLINDSYGHDTGDALLAAMSRRLVQSMRPGDTTGRFGGDEFLVVCEQLGSPDDVVAIADRVLEVIKRRYVIHGYHLYPSSSVGIAVCTGEARAMEMLRDADAAMYAAKARGRDGWFVFDERLRARSTRRLELASGLRAALQEGQLELYYQPIVAAEGLRLEGAELLLRWEHPLEGSISPAELIPIAESSGLIVPLGRWAIDQACRAIVRWRLLFPQMGEMKLSVNVSARQLEEADFANDVCALIARAGARPEDLILEITESALLAEFEAKAEMLLRLGELGVSLAVDDFGTGYSSLSYLKRLPVHSLKVDKLFVDDVDRDAESRSIVKAVVQMAHALHLRVTAEGVETQAQLEVLRELECDKIQGYLIRHPMPIGRFEDLLRETFSSPQEAIG